MLQLFVIALRNLAQHRKRTFLLGGAIAGVTLLLVVLLGLSTGVRETMIRSATTLMTGHVNVAGFFKVTSGQSAAVVTQYEKIEEVVRKALPDEVSYISQRGRGWAKLVSDQSSMQVGIGGIDVQNEPGFREVVQIKSGSLDALTEPNTILLFEEQAKKLEVKVGDMLTFSTDTLRGTSNTIDVRVAAIAANVGLLSSWNVFIPDDTLRTLYQMKSDTTGALHIYLKDIQAVKPAQEKVRAALASAGYQLMDPNAEAFWMKFEAINREDWTGQKLDVTSWEDEISFMKWTLAALTGLSGALISILMVIIAVGVMNTLWIAIRERTREIGTLRAIGMQRGRVMVMFLTEAMFLGLLSATFGALLGVLGVAAINAMNVSVPVSVQLFVMSEQLSLHVEPGAVIGSIVFISACTTVISLIPSFLAARMKPVTAMHHIG